MGASYFLAHFIFKRRRPDQAPEGGPTTIIEGRWIRQDGLAKELLTESELLTVAAPAKGFSSLEEIETASWSRAADSFNNQWNSVGGLE